MNVSPLFTLEGRYLIDAGTPQHALGNDIGCLLEAAQNALEAAGAPSFAALYLLKQARGCFALYQHRVEFPPDHG